MVPIEKVEARSSVDLDNSCNNCCYGCWKVQPGLPKRKESNLQARTEHVMEVLEGCVELTPTEIRVTSSIRPLLREDGLWEMTIERTEGQAKRGSRDISTANLTQSTADLTLNIKKKE